MGIYLLDLLFEVQKVSDCVRQESLLHIVSSHMCVLSIFKDGAS